jgi:endoglucanase
VLLKELTLINGVSGNEEEVKIYIKNNIKALVDDFIEDDIGNLICIKRCKNKKVKNPKKIMLSAHMDEVGFMVSEIADNGLLKFVQAGGVDEKVLPGIFVQVGLNNISGVIIDNSGLYIDLGSKSKEESCKVVSPGDYITFTSSFVNLGNNLIKAKALDDRAGCGVIMEILNGVYDFDLYACFVVQEEVGLRGSEVAAYIVNPDFALVIEGTTCSDISDVNPLNYSTIMGNGPAISILDKSTYYNSRFNNAIKEVAAANKIPLQVKNTFTGGNDSGKIQRSNKGVKTAVISVPVRYIHSPVSVMSLSDYEETVKLVRAVLTELDFEKI